MKDILISILWFAVISFAFTTNYHISFRPLKFSIEHFNWGYTIGLFLVLVGFFISVGYARHLEREIPGISKDTKTVLKMRLNWCKKNTERSHE